MITQIPVDATSLFIPPDEIWFIPGDLVERWAEAYDRGWDNLTVEEQNALLGDMRQAARENRIGRIKNFSDLVASSDATNSGKG